MRENLKINLFLIAVSFLVVDCQFIVDQLADGQFSSTKLVYQRKTTFNFSRLFDPLPSSINTFLDKIDFYTGDIMIATKLLVQIQGSLSSSFGLNTQVKNSSAASYLNSILQPHRTSFNQFFTEYSKTPLLYKNIFKMFVHLNGTVDKIALLVDELSSVVNILSESKDEIFKKMKIFSSQDFNYFAIDETKNRSGLPKQVLNQFMEFFIDQNLIQIKQKLNESSQDDLEFFDHIVLRPDTVPNRDKVFHLIVNEIVKNQNFVHDMKQILEKDSVVLDVKFLNDMAELAPYLSCSYIDKISVVSFVSNKSGSDLIGYEIYNRLFECNVKFVFDLVELEKSASFSVSPDIKPLLVRHYLIYKMRMNDFESFAEISTLLAHIPVDILEKFFLMSYLSDGLNQNTLSYSKFGDFIEQLKAKNISMSYLRKEIVQLIQNHGFIYLNFKKFLAWNQADWDLFNLLRYIIDFDKIESLLNINKRYADFLDLSNSYNSSFWLEDCEFTRSFYNYLIYFIRDTQNDTSSVTIEKTKALIVCKEDCDFSPWLNENSTSSQTRSLVANYLPFMSPYAKQTCRGTEIINSFKNLIMDLNTVSSTDFDLIMNSGFELKTLFTNNEIKLLPDAVLKSFLPKIIAMDFDKASARIILGKVFDENNPDLSKYGNLIIGMDSSFLNSLTTETVNTNFDIFLKASVTADDYFKKIFINKYFGSTFDKNKIIKLLKTNRRDLTDLITIDRIVQANFLLGDLESLNLPNDVVPNSILRYLIDEYLKAKPIYQWTLTDLKKADPIIFPGLTQANVFDLIRNIGIDAIRILVNRNSKYSIPSNLLKAVVQGLINNLMAKYGEKPSDYMKNIPNDIIDILNPAALLELSPDEIKELSQRAEFLNILDKLSKADFGILLEYPPAIPQVYAKYFIDYIKKLRVNERKPGMTLDTIDLDRLGPSLFKYLPLSEILSISPCPLAERAHFFDSIEKTGLLTDEDIQKINTLLDEKQIEKCFPNQRVGGICKYIKSSKCPIVFQVVKEAADIAKKLIPGLSTYVSAAQCGVCTVRSLFKSRSCGSKCNGVISNLKKIIRKPISIILNKVVNRVVSRVKKTIKKISRIFKKFRFGKRDLSDQSFTCDQIKLLGFSVTELTYEEIIYMDMNNFEICLSEFASYDEFSDDAYEAFRQKLVQLYKTTSIDDEKIIEMGSLVKGFRPDEISLWSIEKMDTLASLGSLNLTRQQIDVLGRAAKRIRNTTDPFNEFELINLGNVICGLDANDLRAIQTETFKNSIPTMSNLAYGCDNVIYKELFAQYKKVFNSSFWSRSRLNEIGILTSGISVQDVNDYLNQDLISSFIPESFQKIEFDVLKKIAQTKQLYQNLDRQQLSQLVENSNFGSLDGSLKDPILNEFDSGFSKVLNEIQNNSSSLLLDNSSDQLWLSGANRLGSYDYLILVATSLAFFVLLK